MEKINKSYFNIYVILSPLFFFIGLFAYEITKAIQPIIFSFFVVYIFTLYASIKYSGIFSLYSVYLYTSCFFIYNSFFFTLFGDENFLKQTFPIVYFFSEEIGVKLVITSFLHVYISNIFYFCKRNKFNKSIRKEHNEKQYLFFNRLSKSLFFLFLIPVLYKIFLQLSYVSSNGYTSLFTGQLNNIDYPFFCRGAFFFFMTSFLIFLATTKSKKDFLFYGGIYFIVFLFDALKGARTQIISLLLVLFFIYSKKFNKTIRIKTLFLSGFFILLLVVGISVIRESYDGKKYNNIGILDLVYTTLYGQTTTRAVPMLVIDGNLKYHNYPFIFSPLFEPFLVYAYNLEDGQSDLSAIVLNNISQVTMYNVSREDHLSGFGYGGSFLAEAYDLAGYLGIVIMSFFLVLVLLYFDRTSFSYGIWSIPVVYFVLMSIPVLPRNRFFGFALEINKLIFCYFFSFIIVFLISYVKRKYMEK